MDLFGPSRIMSIGENYYALIIVDDFSKLTWTLFFKSNSTFYAFKKLAKLLQNKHCNYICSIQSDHGGEFQNEKLAITILNESSKPKYLWVDVVSITCYVMNRVLNRPILKKPLQSCTIEENPTLFT